MENITYVMEKSNSDFFTVMKMPYAVFLSSLKHFRLREIQSTPEGRELLEKSKRRFNTKADLGAIRALTGYKKG